MQNNLEKFNGILRVEKIQKMQNRFYLMKF